jgi:hypothetical protein
MSTDPADKIKCLTISQPYASLIAEGDKWVENRRWGTAYRGLLGIHAGKGMQYLDATQLADYPTGAILAVARLVACYSITELRDKPYDELLADCDHTVASVLRHEHTAGPYCWILRDVRQLDPHVLYSGAQGLWEVPAKILTPNMEQP